MSDTELPPDIVAPRLPAGRERPPAEAPSHKSLIRELRGPLTLGLSAILAFFLFGGFWAATAPLSGAAIAPGIVSPESSRQTVQHLEGGIIRELMVREGQRVMAGDQLVILEDVGAQAEAGARMSRLRALLAAEARLRAERADSDDVAFDHPALADRDDPGVRAAIETQLNQLRTRRENNASRSAILRQRVAQLDKQIQGFERQLSGVRRQQALIAEEIAGVNELFEKGLERKPRLLTLQRTEAELLGTEGELEARIARAQEAIGETELQIVNLKIERL
ncbi:MAG: HlyD family type I secretion periplasmic adaptor subunit, partial [Alphaproteobacteria bacterium]